MPNFPDICDALARHDNRADQTVRHIIRTLRAAGHFGPIKRGRGSRDVTYRDVAICLIAWTGSLTSTDAALMVDRFNALPSTFDAIRVDPNHPFHALVVSPTLIDAVEQMLRGALDPRVRGAGIRMDLGRRKAQVWLEWVPDGRKTATTRSGRSFEEWGMDRTPPDLTLSRGTVMFAESGVILWLARMMVGAQHPLYLEKYEPARKEPFGAAHKKAGRPRHERH